MELSNLAKVQVGSASLIVPCMLTILFYVQLTLGPYKIPWQMWRARPRQQMPIQWCCQMWSVSASDIEFKIDQASPARTICFKYLGWNIQPKGINYQELSWPSMRRRSCSGKPPNWKWEWTLAVSPRSLLHKVFPPQTPHARASSHSTKKIVHQLERTQTGIPVE